MNNLSVNEIIAKIENEEIFSANCSDNSFSIIIDKYVPYICAAIHNGSNLNKDLEEKINISNSERWKEEDPFTSEFIESHPIRIIGNDTRYEYDLNRSTKDCIYEEAWGKKVWKVPLSKIEKEKILLKHNNFYKVLFQLNKKIIELFKSSIVYDIHSYNYQREGQDNNIPLFNIGTENINRKKYSKYVENFIFNLKKSKFKYFETRAVVNEVFYGRGYFLKFLTENFKNTLVLATEIKKIYCNENTGEVYPVVIQNLKKFIKTSIINNSGLFAKNETNIKTKHKYSLLNTELENIVLKIDKKLYSLLKEFEILPYVNPQNIEHEKKLFFDSKFRRTPKFSYKPLNVDIYTLKKKLYMLPIDEINDISLQFLYQDIVKDYEKKIDMLFSRGSDDFKYNSLILYGKPDSKDIKNASFLIHLTNKFENIDNNYFSEEEITNYFKNELKKYDFNCKIEFSKKLTARAMVINSKKTLKLKRGNHFNKNDLELLSNHEIGVHMVTTMNASLQKLKFLTLGTPNNIETQEGLAILSELLSGNMELRRLRDLAFRVFAVNMMLKGYSFNEVFEYFIDEHNFENEKAFYLTARIFRGGGFTKDYLYLKGFKTIFDFYHKVKDIDLLFTGKTSYDYFDLFKEMHQRGYIEKPVYINPVFKEKKESSEILDFIVNSLK